jgi:hypothetical protein
MRAMSYISERRTRKLQYRGRCKGEHSVRGVPSGPFGTFFQIGLGR